VTTSLHLAAVGNPAHTWASSARRAALFARAFAAAAWRFRSLRGEALRDWQERQAQRAFSFAVAHSPFWRARAGGLTPQRWRELPVVDKATVMADFDAFNTRGVGRDEATAFALRALETGDYAATLRGLTVGLSSGTSGHRTISLLDDDEQAGFAGFMLSRLLDGVGKLQRQRVAFFMRANSKAYEAAGVGPVDYRFFGLDLDEDAVVDGLARLQPTMLLAPPAMLGVIAALVSSGRLRIRPAVVLSVAEVLEPQQRDVVEGVFGVVVRDVYHTSEGLIGVSCRRGKLHLAEDVTHVELAPLGDGRFTPIQTQLFRRVLPFLRYRMNDVVTVDDAGCGCGSAFRVLARVEGRCDDVFFLRQLRGGLRRVFPDQVRQAVLATDGVRDYRVEQLTTDHLRVAVDVDAAFDVGAFRDRLLAHICVDGCVVPVVDVVHGIAPATDRKQKLVRVRRRFPDPTTTAPTTNSTSAATTQLPQAAS
jgi:putative adenylate-forming enzyme